MQEESPFMKSKIVWIAGAAIVLGCVIVWMIIEKNVAEAPTVPEMDGASSVADGSNKPAVDPLGMNDSFTVVDQDAGMKVAVRELQLGKEAWLVVHELRADGSRGNALGAGLFSADAAFAEIPLLRGTEAGKKYSVLIYADDGDRQFDIKKDVPQRNANAEIISASFFALTE